MQAMKAYGYGSTIPALLTILVSAVIHDYVMGVGMGFCFPLVSVLFGIIGGEFWATAVKHIPTIASHQCTHHVKCVKLLAAAFLLCMHVCHIHFDHISSSVLSSSQ